MKVVTQILLLDDDLVNRWMLEEMAREVLPSVTIYTAENGRAGLQILEKLAQEGKLKRPLIILLDVKMPVMDGFEFLEAIAPWKEAIRQQLKIILLITPIQVKDPSAFGYSPIDGYVAKPFTEEKLLQLKNLFSQ